MSDGSGVVAISINGFVRKKPLSDALLRGAEPRYPFRAAYEIRCLDRDLSALVAPGLDVVATRGEWLRFRAEIDAFYETYSNEEIIDHAKARLQGLTDK